MQEKKQDGERNSRRTLTLVLIIVWPVVIAALIVVLFIAPGLLVHRGGGTESDSGISKADGGYIYCDYIHLAGHEPGCGWAWM